MARSSEETAEVPERKALEDDQQLIARQLAEWHHDREAQAASVCDVETVLARA